ncbi:sodium-dependent transporter [Succinatimonas hippei]|uniref:Transporter n=1 Tax=Succinatimonas hippei (strain DSM 22608 / JCM 16073 / KCTC 15190 / YIT 12066) TaxID=762983 RepID=E8LKU4_SUCHY|nr:sodium-dependent transporter [Succinatimonas hippei]EFY06858.1 Sodium:neurotransmitter symporter family protein [Succinatimonas hippei YIT 12066]MDM8120623.1 sodium-dependent transporter [Succinatimonas hippei]
MAREQFSSRLGFLLIAAGCSIGLGNVWRFPYITGEYGGAIFLVIYLFFLFLVGVPILTIELAVGRASRRSLGKSFEEISPNTKWNLNKFLMISGNYVLMAFYSLVTGWMFYYMIKVGSGAYTGVISRDEAGGLFGSMLADPASQFICTLIVVIGSFAVCACGLQKGVERITKPMMILLFVLLVFMAARSFILPGAKEGISYYLMPNFSNLKEHGILNTLSAAMAQSFFTLGLGVGSIQIFGSYMNREHTLFSEGMTLTILNTVVAVLSGFIIFPACFSYGVQPDSGPGLVFISLVSVFSNMAYGQVWGAVFFLFMLFASVSTLIAVFENIIAICMEIFDISRVKSVVYNCIVIILLGIPCLLGYNLWSDIQPLGAGSTILDTYDFILSKNILPYGTLCYILYVVLKRGWGFDNYLKEANTGIGIKIPLWALNYYKFVLPVVIVVLFLQGYVEIFGK